MSFARFTVTTERLSNCWLVIIEGPGDDEFARVHAPDLDTAMRMAVPYMVYATEPDPLAELLRDQS